MDKVILTGDRPTGRLHIGHYVGSLRSRVELQNKGDYDKFYIMIADVQALTDNWDNPEKVRQNIIEVALDYLSVGIDPSKVTIFIQSGVKGLYQLTCFYMDVVTLSRLQRNPTIKSELKMREFGESIPVGFMTYPISQAADITGFDATIIPVGDDQLPMIEQTREIVRSINNIYGETLYEPEAVLPSNDACRRLPGTDGNAKMSKSLGNCIYLADDSDTVKKKVMGMYTDPNHIRVEDPGQVEGNMVFTYLDCFCKEDSFKKFLPEFKDLDELKAAYKKGGLGDVKIKNFLYQILEEELTPVREKRKYYEEHIDEVYEILKKGTEDASKHCDQVVDRLRKNMKINYFDNKEIIEKYTN
ncbi:MAG: tryptophan--tRNA ligase [Bacilli bacterium]|nr:tryptophan--tRNA ligase [Bacilli bacterium]